MYKTLRGTKDILPSQHFMWSNLEDKAKNTFKLFGYKRISTPIIEEKKLFCRTLGQDTEIVQKQMFEIKRDKEIYVLRPEGTAGIIRAYLENHLDKTSKIVKLYYKGPMFRAERPQRGRLRQFYHIGAEAIGSYSPFLDVEIISLVDLLINHLGIENYSIRLNSLGCKKDKQKFAKLLRQKLRPHLKKLCTNCKIRFNSNILRILDCKKSACQKSCSNINLDFSHYLCRDCQAHFHTLLTALNLLNIKYLLDPLLVRGLDYYTRTVFEFSHPDLGSQDAIGAGGRYDDLVCELGGAPTGAVGFALGLERLVLIIEKRLNASGRIEIGQAQKILIYIATLGREAYMKGFSILNQLRKNGISADIDYHNASLKSQFRQADKLGVKFVVILGEDELKQNLIKLRDMDTGNEERIPMDSFIEHIKLKVKS